MKKLDYEIIKADNRVVSLFADLGKIDAEVKNAETEFTNDISFVNAQTSEKISALHQQLTEYIKSIEPKIEDALFSLTPPFDSALRNKILSMQDELDKFTQGDGVGEHQLQIELSIAELNQSVAKAEQEKFRYFVAGGVAGGIIVICILLWGLLNVISIMRFLMVTTAVGFATWRVIFLTKENEKRQELITNQEYELNRGKQLLSYPQEIERLTKEGEKLLRKQIEVHLCQTKEQKQQKESALRQKRDELIATAEKNKQKKQSDLTQKRKEIIAEFVESWKPSLQSLKSMIEEIRYFQPLLNSLTEENLNTAGVSEILASGIGSINVSLSSIGYKNWSQTIPNLLDFPFSKLIYDEYKEEYKNATDASPLHRLLLRILYALPVGTLEIISIDPKQMGNSLAPFKPLTECKEIVPHGHFITRLDEIESTLQELSVYLEDLIQKRFHAVPDWKSYNEKNPNNKLPYKLLFIFGFPEQFSDKSISYLKGIIEHGPKHGILPIITVDYSKINSLSPYEGKQIKEIVSLLEKNGLRIPKLYSLNRFQLQALSITEENEPFPSDGDLARLLERVKTAYKEHKEGKKFRATIENMWMDEPLVSVSVDGISVLLGWTVDGQEVKFELGDAPPHTLLAGGTGSGKSNLIHVLIHGLLHRYSSDELNLYLLDYKEGTEFKVYANNVLPQIKLVSIDSDSEYGITVLEHLNEELKRRADLFKKSNAKDIKAYRETTGEKLSRVLLIIDEFQVLFQESREIAEKATKLFTNIFKQGRSFGVHVLLATQSLAGMSEFIRPFLSQLGCRIALSCSEDDSRNILGLDNFEAVHLIKRKEAILNNQNGVKSANRKFDVPHAKETLCAAHLRKITEHTKGFSADTKIFNGSFLPKIPSVQEFSKYAGQIVLGEELNFDAPPFAFQWECKAGNNICVIGMDDVIRQGILHSVLYSIQQGNNFDRVIYYNSDPNGNKIALPLFTTAEVKDHTWDCNIEELTTDWQNRRTLLIIDTLDNADLFYPKQKNYNDKTVTPADMLKTLLDQGPRYGSFVLAFVDNWRRFKDYRDYVNNFEMRIGFCLNEDDAGNLATGGFEKLKGLDKPTKAVFVNRQRNIKTVFRPFEVKKNSEK
jgi:hypothetical protein